MNAELFLPWPDKRLSPNARVHWRPLAEVKKKAKSDAFWIAKGAGLSQIGAATITAKYSFFPPDRRARDADNIISSMKAAQDGIALAIGVDDAKWRTSYEFKSPVEKAGMVKVELEWTA